MANPATFMPSYFNNVAQLINVITTLRMQYDQIVQDPGVVTEYFALSPSGPNIPPRTDIKEADVTAAQSALQQVFFTFDSGSPPQKAALYQVMP
jgi:hypothetical protein